MGGAAPLRELSMEIVDRVVGVNIRGTILMTQAVVNNMVSKGAQGAIVNISSIGGQARPFPDMGHYEATKAAINPLTRSAALEFARFGIRINAVAPGVVETSMTRGLINDPQARATMEARVPLGRLAVPADLAPVVVIPVDGGHLLT
ncbi:MAG: SDR family NAD(P)-dependent oxidoreductase [Acidimicrobiales bacterium]